MATKAIMRAVGVVDKPLYFGPAEPSEPAKIYCFDQSRDKSYKVLQLEVHVVDAHGVSRRYGCYEYHEFACRDYTKAIEEIRKEWLEKHDYSDGLGENLSILWVENETLDPQHCDEFVFENLVEKQNVF